MSDWNTPTIMPYSNKRPSVIFKDKNKNILRNPDGYSCYWHILRNKLESIFNRQEEGMLLVNGCFWILWSYFTGIFE